jgi:hypothetical protein
MINQLSVLLHGADFNHRLGFPLDLEFQDARRGSRAHCLRHGGSYVIRWVIQLAQSHHAPGLCKGTTDNGPRMRWVVYFFGPATMGGYFRGL